MSDDMSAENSQKCAFYFLISLRIDYLQKYDLLGWVISKVTRIYNRKGFTIKWSRREKDKK